VEVTSVLVDSAELADNAKLGGDTQRAGWGDTATMVQNYRRRVGAAWVTQRVGGVFRHRALGLERFCYFNAISTVNKSSKVLSLFVLL
jgi:hypothetical protein